MPVIDSPSAPPPIVVRGTAAGRRRHAGAALLLAFAAILALPCARAADALAAPRALFKAALDAAEAGRPAAPGGDPASLRDYPLYPYLLAARLQRRLDARAAAADDAGLDDAVAAFLGEHGAAPVATPLRAAWARSLIARKDWPRYLAAFPTPAADDLVGRCRSHAARIALGQTETLAPAVLADWDAADRSLPDCAAAFDWAIAQGLLTPARIEARARRLLANGYGALALLIARPLDAAAQAPLRQWAALIDDPARALDALIADPSRPVERAALLDGWQRHARKDPDAAEARYEPLRSARELDAATASAMARALALGLSWSRRPSALHWFRQIAADDVDALTAEWWTRASLWAGDWPQARRAIAALPAARRAEQRWRYWEARAALASGDDSGRAQLAALATEDGWYPALAAAQAGEAFAPHPEPIAEDAAAQARLQAQPAAIRARELFRIDRRVEAAREFWIAVEALPEPERAQAAIVAIRWGWYEQGVAAASRAQRFRDYRLLYPQPFDAPVKVAATLTGVAPALIYAVLRQESLYRADAVSRADAYGLLQLLKETAVRTARKWSRPLPTRETLFEPATNVPLGAAYLRDLIDRFDGQTPVAIAGYNAGPNAAARWLPERTLPADIWIENIPYNETRAYVQRVLWHSLVFGWLGSGGKPQPVEPWLAPLVRPAVP